MEYEECRKYFLLTVQIGGIVLLLTYISIALLIGFTTGDFSHILYTTLITHELIFIAMAFKFQNKFINAMFLTNFMLFFFLDAIHLALAIVQVILLISNIKVSRNGLTFGFTFWLIFVFLYDNVYRVLYCITIPLTEGQFLVAVFFLLLVSTVITYLIKNYRGLIV